MANNSEQKVSSALGFTASHLLLIAACLALLLVFSILKGSLTLASISNLNPLKAQEKVPTVLSYDEIKAQVDASYNSSYTADDKSKQQLAEIDPTYGIGEVLGASTQGIPSVDEILTQEQLNSIQVNTFQTNQVKDLQDYADKLMFIENYYGASELIQAYTTQDTGQLKKAVLVYQTLIADLKSMTVPAQVKQYQQYKVLYYASLIDMANSLMAPGNSTTTAGAVFFSILDKLNLLQTDLTEKYGISF